MIKSRLAATLVALTIPTSAVFAVATPAEAAGTKGCITKAEYKKIKNGAPQKRVQKIVGAKGKTDSQGSYGDGDGYKNVSFRQCGTTYGGAIISYEKSEREVYRADIECFDFDGNGSNETCEDFGYYETVYSNPFVVTGKYAYWA